LAAVHPGSAVAVPVVPSRWRQGFIAGPVYDSVCFILSPLLALAAAHALGWFTYPFEATEALAGRGSRIGFFIAVWTSSHLVAVFFRSHLNRQIFGMHKVRFVVVPILLTIAIVANDTVRIVCFVLAVLWDVYHSSMQNFGLGRIYDAKRGNDARAGRWLDMVLNHLLYIGPILGGLSLMATLNCFKMFMDAGWSGPVRLASWLETHQPALRTALVVTGVAFLAGYLVRYAQLRRAGYHVSPQKVALLASVGVSSIWAWGFLPPVEAAFVANLYHALQYFAIVWWIEKKNMTSVFRLASIPGGSAIALLAFLGVVFALGFGIEYSSNTFLLNGGLKWAAAAALVCSLMHFWYDGFIWSVRRKEV
jgi:hypothetical protein